MKAKKRNKRTIIDPLELSPDMADRAIAIYRRSGLDTRAWDRVLEEATSTVRRRWPVLVERLGEDDYLASPQNKQDYFIAILEYLLDGPPRQKSGI